MNFCNDTDLLYWEPDLLKDAAFMSQTLAAGSGDLSGTLFTAGGGVVFDSARVEVGHVITLSGTISGCLAITQLVGGSFLRVSTIYTELFAAASPALAVQSQVATGLSFAVRTFHAQRRLVGDFLLQAAGIATDSAGNLSVDGVAATLLNPSSLKRPACLGVIQLIYSAIAAAASEPARFAARAELYERLYRRTLRQTRFHLDTDGDGQPNLTRDLGLIRLSRE